VGCASTTGQPSAPGSDEARQKLVDEIMPRCDVQSLQPLVGRQVTGELKQDLRRRTGFPVVRVRRPGEAHTQDFRTDRLNVDVDGAGRIVRFSCG